MRIKRKQLQALFALIAIVSAIASVAVYHHLDNIQQQNQQIRSLVQGEGIAAEQLDLSNTQVMLAYGYQQRQSNLMDEAIEIYSAAERDATPQQRVWLYYNLGNLYLTQAITLAENLSVDRAVSMADVAKDFYRSALRTQPNFYLAKYNLEAAQRLSRDLPLGEVEISEESQDSSTELWSAMPGFPIGLP